MKPYFLFLLFAFSILSSCKDMDGIYQDFVVPNGLTYPQKADSLKAYAGFKKLRLQWHMPTDPRVKYAKIYGNNYPDTIQIEIPTGKSKIEVDIPNLIETTYTFYVRTFDEAGNASIPVEVTGTPYGENYLTGTTRRVITSALRNANNDATVTWGNPTLDLVYSEVRYKTSSGEEKTVRINADENMLICLDIKSATQFEYRSVFLPPNGIEYVEDEWRIFETPFLYKYPRSEWSAESRNGNHGWGGELGGEPFRILDGNLNSGWHSRVGTPMPQCIVVDMKQSLEVERLLLYPPANANERYLQKIEVYISDTPIIAGEPDASWGHPIMATSYNGTNPFVIRSEQPASGRYLALVFPDSRVNTYISFMELEVYGY